MHLRGLPQMPVLKRHPSRRPGHAGPARARLSLYTMSPNTCHPSTRSEHFRQQGVTLPAVMTDHAWAYPRPAPSARPVAAAASATS